MVLSQLVPSLAQHGVRVYYVSEYFCQKTLRYSTFHKKKLNDVGWSSGGQHPVGQRSVSGQSAVGQRSVNGRSLGRVNVNTYVIINK